VDKRIVLYAHGRGMMFAVDIVNESACNAIYNALIEKEYIVCNRKSHFKIDPPLITSEDEFNKFINAFKDTLRDK
jgi:4-aminobutyrate aminotransferase-like enzyme